MEKVSLNDSKHGFQLISGKFIAKSKSALDWAKCIIKTKGFFGLYIGYRIHLLRDIIGTGFYFSSYETFKFLMTNGTEASPWIHMMGGGIAGIISSLVIYPIDS